MLTLTKKALLVYQEALELYQKEEYEKALNLLPDNGNIPARWRLLRAYCQRANKAYLSEIQELNKIMDMQKEKGDKEYTNEECAFLADVFSLLGSALSFIGLNEGALISFCESAKAEPEADKKLVEISNAIFVSNFYEIEKAELFKLFDFYKKFSKPDNFTPLKKNDGMFRLGILSSDLNKHPVGSLLVAIFRHLDRDKFLLYVYANVEKEDNVTEFFREKADVWKDIKNISTNEVKEIIRRDALDFIFELGGHTAKNCLPVLAHRVARIQLSGIGYMASTGLDEVDYFIGDCYLDEAEKNEWFSEKLLRFSKTHFCYTPLIRPSAVKPSPCLTNGYITFGSFNTIGKITDKMLLLWAEILNRVEGSRLVLKNKLFDSEEGKRYTRERLLASGIELARVSLRGFSSTYLTEYGDIDIALDTFPYTGGMTTIEALFMGVPVVSLYGDRHGTRFGYSLLSNLNLGELAVKSPTEYVERAVALAKDTELLSALRSNLRKMMEESPLMNGKAWVKEFEELLRGAFNKYIRSKDE